VPVFDVSDFEPLQIEQVTQPGLVLPIVDGEEAFLCLQDGDALSAVFLSGEWGFCSDRLESLSGRRGLHIPSVSIRADLGSMVADAIPYGALVRSPGVYGVRTLRHVPGGFNQAVTVPINGGEPQFAPDAIRVAFTKWEIGKVIDDNWVRLWSVEVPAQ
jgi:hypothetical protein